MFRTAIMLSCLAGAMALPSSLPSHSGAPTLRGATAPVMRKSTPLQPIRGGKALVEFDFNPKDLFITVSGTVLAFMILGIAHKKLTDEGFSAMCPPLGATALLLFCSPDAASAQPYNTALGFLFGSAAAVGMYKLVGPDFLKEFGGTRALVLGASVAAMKITNSIHPPAAAYAVLLADAPAMQSLGWKYILYPGLTGAAILMLAQQLIFKMKTLLA